MLEKLQKEYDKLIVTPPWKKQLRPNRFLPEGLGAPEPGEYENWQTNIKNLELKMKGLIEEENARRLINRP